MKKENLKLVCTCDICPEQYDVFAEGYKYSVGYIRFRSGWFTCQTLDESGNTVFRPIIVVWEDLEGNDEIPAIIKDDLLDICKDAICQYFTTEERLTLVDEKYKEYLSMKEKEERK